MPSYLYSLLLSMKNVPNIDNYKKVNPNQQQGVRYKSNGNGNGSGVD